MRRGMLLQGCGCRGKGASVYIRPQISLRLVAGSDRFPSDIRRQLGSNTKPTSIGSIQHLCAVFDLAIAFPHVLQHHCHPLRREPTPLGLSIFRIVYFGAKWARGIRLPEQGIPYFPPTTSIFAPKALIMVGQGPSHASNRLEERMNFDVENPQAMPAGYKPSPLGPYGSPRSSPFRRPESPASPSAVRQASTQVTPSGSPTKASYATNNGRFGNPTTPTETVESRTPRVRTPTGGETNNIMTSPIAARPALKKSVSHGGAIAQLQPAQVRTLREGFEILDRDSDGIINRDDVADMLNQLGKSTM